MLKCSSRPICKSHGSAAPCSRSPCPTMHLAHSGCRSGGRGPPVPGALCAPRASAPGGAGSVHCEVCAHLAAPVAGTGVPGSDEGRPAVGRGGPKVTWSPSARTRIRARRAPVLAQRPHPASLLLFAQSVLLCAPRAPGWTADWPCRPEPAAQPRGPRGRGQRVQCQAPPPVRRVGVSELGGPVNFLKRVRGSLASRAWCEQGSRDHLAVASP